MIREYVFFDPKIFFFDTYPMEQKNINKLKKCGRKHSEASLNQRKRQIQIFDPAILKAGDSFKPIVDAKHLVENHCIAEAEKVG